jgi:hypothetical protein
MDIPLLIAAHPSQRHLAELLSQAAKSARSALLPKSVRWTMSSTIIIAPIRDADLDGYARDRRLIFSIRPEGGAGHALSANMPETPPRWKFSVEGEQGAIDGDDGDVDQVELAEARGVGHQVDGDDLPGNDGSATGSSRRDVRERSMSRRTRATAIGLVPSSRAIVAVTYETQAM